MWSLVPDNDQARIELQILGHTDLNHVDYGSIDDLETTLPRTSRLPKSTIHEDGGGREWTRTIDLTDVNRAL